MSWEAYRDVMELHAIKTDDMATEDAYFMATHMPFSALEVIAGGRVGDAPALMTEEEVYRQLILNPDDHHRLIIVRGDNGTGKSHLIRYQKARFENDAAHYHPEREQLIFLRRLNNSVRGAFSQLLEQNVIRNPDVRAKLEKFVRSAHSKDKDAFQTEILFSFTAAVMSDKSGEVYPPVICRNISQYLSDSRVQDHLLREEGAIARCYRSITAPSALVLEDTAIFTPADFALDRKVQNAVISQGNPEASDFATTLKNDGDEVAKLVKYLNRFAPAVVQRCADISSEDTKSVFQQLRRDLKSQGKNLTLFIEDFTGFTGIDAELITVLSTEHGGAYADLCRVTSVIGITNGYYDQFKDNFKDRVTHQISVTQQSYGNIDFLTHLTGRYLNAIYCPPEKIRGWFQAGADSEALPVSDFRPPCPWEAVPLGRGEATLYPFNRRALEGLYEDLSVKTPRRFLTYVVRKQLKEYFDGKEYGDQWGFPAKMQRVQMKNEIHSSRIDGLEEFSPGDRLRLKSVFALWGDGTAGGIRRGEEIFFGGVSKAFLEDIGLAAFEGLGEIRREADAPAPAPAPPPPKSPPAGEQKAPPTDQAAQRQARDHERKQADIDGWYSGERELQYHPDYREWLRVFVREAVQWQAEGVPAYLADDRLSDKSAIYIEGQSGGAPERAILRMDRSAESKDALKALSEYHHAGRTWLFEGSGYFQQKLITWLERNKGDILARIWGDSPEKAPQAVLEQALAVQYLKAQILGCKVNTRSPLAILEGLVGLRDIQPRRTRKARQWSDVIGFIAGEEAAFLSVQELLQKSAATTMGAINRAKVNTTPFYRTEELLRAVDRLLDRRWNLEEELPAVGGPVTLLQHPGVLLSGLYSRIRAVVKGEGDYVADTLSQLTGLVGELTEDNLLTLLDGVQTMYAAFHGIPYGSELKARFDGPPIDRTRRILALVKGLKKAEGAASPIEGLALYAASDSDELHDFLNDLLEVERLAQREEARAVRELTNLGPGGESDDDAQEALALVEALYDRLEGMEVQHDAD